MIELNVVIPTYNRPQLLSEALASVIQQKSIEQSTIEVVVVNDGGQSVEDVIEGARSKGLKVKLINHGHNRGLASARNTGLESCDGPFICFLDDDDIFLDCHLATALRFLRQGVDIVSSQCLVVEERWASDEYKPPVITGCWSIGYHQPLLAVTNTLPIHSAVMRRSKVAVFDESLDFLEDWNFWLCFGLGGRIITHHVDEPTVIYFRTLNSMILGNSMESPHTLAKILKSYTQICFRHGEQSEKVAIYRATMMAMYAMVMAQIAIGHDVDPHYYHRSLELIAESWNSDNLEPTILSKIAHLIEGRN